MSISGNRCGVRLPCHHLSDHHARLRREDSPEDPKLWQEQHSVEESEGHRRGGATA